MIVKLHRYLYLVQQRIDKKMDLYPNTQNFRDGLAFSAKRSKQCEDAYIEFFLESYRVSGDSKYAKNNAIRLACGMVDQNIINLEIL